MANLNSNTQSWKVEIPVKIYNKAEGFITVTKFNNSGSLLYVGDNSSKKINVINTKNWKIIGSYIGHKGVIWDIDISDNDDIMVSGSGDLTLGFWYAKTGENIRMFEPLSSMSIPVTLSIQKNVLTKYLVVFCKAKTKTGQSCINFYDLDKVVDKSLSDDQVLHKSIKWTDSNDITSIKWIDETKYIIGTSDGRIIIKDFVDEEFIQEKSVHTGAIKTIVFNRTKTGILTSSLDSSAKEIDLTTLEIQGEYKSKVPINSAIYSQKDRTVILGGGIDAMAVALSGDNDLSIKIFRKKDRKLLKEIKSHFGPIRCLNAQPESKNFVSGGHDGLAKIYLLDTVEDGDETQENEEKEEDIKSETSIETFNIINYTAHLGIHNVVGKSLSDGKENMELVNVHKQIVNRQNHIQNQNNIPGSKNSTAKSDADELFMVGSRDFLAETEEKRKQKHEEKKKLMEDDDLFVVKAESNDDESDSDDFVPMERTTPGAVRVSNLPMHMDKYELKKMLQDLFDSFGKVTHIAIPNVSFDRIAFINYADVNKAHKAIEIYTNKKHVIEHQIMCVELAPPRN